MTDEACDDEFDESNDQCNDDDNSNDESEWCNMLKHFAFIYIYI